MLSGRRLAEQQQILYVSFRGAVYHSKVMCSTVLGKALQSLYIFFLRKASFYTLIAEIGTQMFPVGLELSMFFYVTESLLECHHLGN